MSSRDSASVAARRGAAATLSSLFMLGLMATALLMMVQQVRLMKPYRMASEGNSFRRLMLLPPVPEIRPASPSPDLIKEMGMSSTELLDRWNPLIEEAADRFHIPAAWLKAVMRRESGGRTLLSDGTPITSPVGAQGVMQLMPGTYKQMAEQYRLGDNPFDPRDNVLAAAGYLRWLHAKFGFPAMFAAYNYGPGNYKDSRGHSLPTETRNYLKAISAELGVRWRAPVEEITFTRPNGSKVKIDAAKVSAVRPAFPGEYAKSVHSVISMGRTRQGVRETVLAVTQRLRQQGVRV